MPDEHGRIARLRTEMALRRPRRTDRLLRRQVLAHVRPVTQPLVLISQMQRSGGTLLNQLLDGAPGCLTHPPELYVGHRDKETWPELDLSCGPEAWFARLYERRNLLFLSRGYYRVAADTPPLPFLVHPGLQRDIFLRTVRERPPTTSRHVLDAYWTSYFGAWLDHQRPPGAPRWVVGFVPGLLRHPQSTDGYLRDYPDGRLVSVVREPVSWYASTKHHKSYRSWRDDPDTAVARWVQATSEALRRLDELGPERVLLLSFETLTRERGTAVDALCRFLGLEPDPSLLAPTFNGHPIGANSSFRQALGAGDEQARARTLSDTERARVEELAGPLHAAARSRCAA